jgi:hypothetical protein
MAIHLLQLHPDILEIVANILINYECGNRFILASTCKPLRLLLPAPYKTSPATFVQSVALLQWSCGYGYQAFTDESTYIFAALGGHLDVLEWLSLGHSYVAIGITYAGSSRPFAAAACGGHLDVLEWLRGRECLWDIAAFAAAARAGHLDVLQWLWQNCPFTRRQLGADSALTCTAAAEGGHLEVLKWLRQEVRQEQFDWDSTTFTAAAENGHFEVLKWLRKNKCPWDVKTCAAAARGGHFEILKWLRTNGLALLDVCPWNEDTCAEAARGGHFEILKWAHSTGLRMDPRTCLNAAAYGHLDVLKWARANGCAWDTGDNGHIKWRVCMAAAHGGHLEVLKWLWGLRTSSELFCCTNDFYQAAATGKQKLLQWTRSTKYEWDELTWHAHKILTCKAPAQRQCGLNDWDYRMRANAGCGGHIAVQEWLRFGLEWE